MAQKLNANNTAKVPFVGKLLKNSGRRPTHCIFEIDRISQIYSKGKSVD
jgi:hypothetical protein